jgi:hypothetical protein
MLASPGCGPQTTPPLPPLDDVSFADAGSDGGIDSGFDAGVAEGLPPRPGYAPSMLVKAEDKARILERIKREPFTTLLTRIQQAAARGHVDLPPDTFDSQEAGNGETAQAAAFLAWLQGDGAMAAKARDFFTRLSDNFASHTDMDIDIRIPAVLIGYTFALDLLLGAELIPAAEAEAMELKLKNIADAFYQQYVLDEATRTVAFYYTQNNHPIRAASALATAAMAFPEHPRAEKWANWALWELTYLWGPDGQYVQPDGGVSEGPHYYQFGFTPSLAFSLAWNNRIAGPRVFKKDCINQQDHEPWGAYKCKSGEKFVYGNLIFEERFFKSVEWSLFTRLPDGRRPPLEDGTFKSFNGIGILASFLNRPDYLWDWQTGGYNTGWGMDLAIQHLAYAPDSMTPQSPAWTSRLLPDAGHAVFRSGWETDALWVFLTAEHGSARMTIHDHVDAGSFTMAAYGEYLLMDSGYHKPSMANNAVTAQAQSHNVLMIDGEPVPPKGLLVNFGDTDAFLENGHISENLAYAEARQPLDVTTTERSVMMVRNRYVVSADRVITSGSAPRVHTWRMHGYAGHDTGGTFAISADHAGWEREKAGVYVYLASNAPGLALSEPAFAAGEPPHVHNVAGKVENHGVLDGKVTAVAPGFLAVAAPYRVGATPGAGDAPLEVTPVTAIGVSSGVAGWTVRHSGGTDLVILRSPSAPQDLALSTGHSLSTDAELLLLTIDGDTPLSMMARGSRCTLDGKTVFENRTGKVSVSE